MSHEVDAPNSTTVAAGGTRWWRWRLRAGGDRHLGLAAQELNVRPWREPCEVADMIPSCPPLAACQISRD